MKQLFKAIVITAILCVASAAAALHFSELSLKETKIGDTKNTEKSYTCQQAFVNIGPVTFGKNLLSCEDK